MVNIYRTISEKQMKRLIAITGRFRYDGCFENTSLYVRTNSRVDVLYHWVNNEPIPRWVAIRPVTLTSKPYRFYKLQS